jgi:hypothetical protein
MSNDAESARLKALKGAPLDAWIVLSGDETTVLASAPSFEEISGRIKELGSGDDFVVLKTPKSWVSLSV